MVKVVLKVVVKVVFVKKVFVESSSEEELFDEEVFYMIRFCLLFSGELMFLFLCFCLIILN